MVFDPPDSVFPGSTDLYNVSSEFSEILFITSGRFISFCFLGDPSSLNGDSVLCFCPGQRSLNEFIVSFDERLAYMLNLMYVFGTWSGRGYGGGGGGGDGV